MRILDYFLKMLPTDNIYKLKWYYSVMTIPGNETFTNEYCKGENGSYYVMVDNEWFIIEDRVLADGPLIVMTDVLVAVGRLIPNLDKQIETTYGIILANKLLIADIIGNGIPFINGNIDISNIEEQYIKKLRNKEISVKNYTDFVNTGMFLQGLSRITTISSTPKGILPAPGIKEYKAKVLTEMTAKYGPNWVKDKAYVVEFENILKAYDALWLADDPSDGKILSGKVKYDARSKMYLAFGAEAGFDETGTDVNLVTNSLLEGYPKDAKQLAVIFNTSRAGSYYRGKETQNGGANAKDALRATSSIVIKPGDCGAILGKPVTVGKWMEENLSGRYIVVNNQPVLITNVSDYIGQTVILRTPQFCLEPGTCFCAVCSGNHMAAYPNGVSLLTTDVTGIILNSSLKKMHMSTSKTMKFNIVETIR